VQRPRATSSRCDEKRQGKVVVKVSDQILIAVDAAGICRTNAMTPDGEHHEEGLDYRIRYGLWTRSGDATCGKGF
jgi:hypothetical protein